jgi:hypothetical protein
MNIMVHTAWLCEFGSSGQHGVRTVEYRVWDSEEVGLEGVEAEAAQGQGEILLRRSHGNFKCEADNVQWPGEWSVL